MVTLRARICWQLFAMALGMLSVNRCAIAVDENVIGRKIGSLSFTDVNGKSFDLANVSQEKLVVVAFWGTECPIAKKYVANVRKIAEAHGDLVEFVFVFPNDQDSTDDVKRYVEQMAISQPAFKDQNNRVADQFAARRTPEVYVLDRSRTIRYRGLIDDQHGVGFSKKEATNNYLTDAIENIFAAKDVVAPQTEPVGCIIGRIAAPKSQQVVTFAAHIAPILNQHCVGCHQANQIGPMALTDAGEVAGWAAMIDEVVRDGRMPPWNANPDVGTFSNQRRLSKDEKQLIAQWVASGAAIGDRKQIPAYQTLPAGWQLPNEPDLVLEVSPEPVAIAATGEMDYLHFRSEHVFEEEKWVRAIQIRPGNHAVVHHILAFIDSPNGREVIGELEGIDGYLAGYVPGLTIEPYPPGMAKRIPKNSRLIFQVHYTPIGTPQTDQSQIGFYFADPKSVEREVITTSAIRRKLEIPPGSPDHQVVAFSHRSLASASLLGMMPHMHLRGKSFRFDLQSSNGKVTPLLDVPKYDFHWQSSYRLSEPIPLQDGDKICCTAQFDNSPANSNNPDPTQTVRWGDQTREEMMIGYFDIAVDRTDFESDRVDLKRHVVLVRIMDRYDANRDGIVEQHEIPAAVVRRFKALDANADDRVTFAELAQKWDR